MGCVLGEEGEEVVGGLVVFIEEELLDTGILSCDEGVDVSVGCLTQPPRMRASTNKQMASFFMPLNHDKNVR